MASERDKGRADGLRYAARLIGGECDRFQKTMRAFLAGEGPRVRLTYSGWRRVERMVDEMADDLTHQAKGD